MSKTLSISYDLKPPAGTPVPDSHQPSKSHEYTVAPGGSQQEFYKSLRDVTLQAKGQIGADLTAWRDAVGTSENVKEPKKGQKEDDDDDEGDVEE